ncbi:hypothetical protein IWX49DRAFT_236805 [Phyllosticta citricarpa]
MPKVQAVARICCAAVRTNAVFACALWLANGSLGVDLPSPTCEILQLPAKECQSICKAFSRDGASRLAHGHLPGSTKARPVE